MWPLGDHGEQVGESVGRDAVLGVFVRDVDLDQHGQHPTGLGRLRVEGVGQAEGVEGVEQVGARGGVPRLVALERPDQVPPHVPPGALARQRIRLVDQLLDTVLAQVAQPRGDGGADGLQRARFGDGDERDLGRVTTGRAWPPR